MANPSLAAAPRGGGWVPRELKINQDGFSNAPRMRKRAPKDARKKPSGLQETFKRSKMSRRWSQAKLQIDLGGAKGAPRKSKAAQDGIKSAPETEEKGLKYKK